MHLIACTKDVWLPVALWPFYELLRSKVVHAMYIHIHIHTVYMNQKSPACVKGALRRRVLVLYSARGV